LSLAVVARRVLALAVGVSFAGLRVAAQTLTPGPPGPFVVDVRGITTGVPTSITLYPNPPSTTFLAPSRGFGPDVGAHVYPLTLGPARIGVGANFVSARGSTSDADLTMQMVVPQLSFNFGTSNGWSYLSAGIGPVRVKTTETFTTTSVNAGGGARWFLNDHMAIGFDLRLHRLSAKEGLPRTFLGSASVGLSLK